MAVKISRSSRGDGQQDRLETALIREVGDIKIVSGKQPYPAVAEKKGISCEQRLAASSPHS